MLFRSVVKNSLVAGGTEIYGTVLNSIIGSRVIIEKGAIVKDSVVFSDTIVKQDAVVNYSIIDEKVVIGENAKIGEEKSDDVNICVIGRDNVIGNGEVVPAGANLDRN